MDGAIACNLTTLEVRQKSWELKTRLRYMSETKHKTTPQMKPSTF